MYFSLSLCVCVQIADLLVELADERSTSESASQMLETETSERLRLEKDLKDLQAHMNTLITTDTPAVTTQYLKRFRF